MNSNELKKLILKIADTIILMTIKIENFDKKLIQKHFGF